jgi:hypothetical protein
VALSAKETDYLLDEWARWQRMDPYTMSWPKSAPFGRYIKPDPVPAREPVDEERALATDRVLARMPRRYRFLVRMHYLDSAPIDAKARRMRMGRKAYLLLLEGVQRVVGARLDGTSLPATFSHAARAD